MRLRVLALLIVVGCAKPRDKAPQYRAYVEKIDRGAKLGRSAVLGVTAADATLAPRLVGLLRDAARVGSNRDDPPDLDGALAKIEKCATDVACLVLVGKELDGELDYLTWGTVEHDQLTLRMVRVRGNGHGVIAKEIVAIAGDDTLDARTRAAYSRLVARARGTTIRLVGPRKLKVRLDGKPIELPDRRRSIDHVAAGPHRVDLVLTTRWKSSDPRERTIAVDFVADDTHDIVIKLDD